MDLGSVMAKTSVQSKLVTYKCIYEECHGPVWEVCKSRSLPKLYHTSDLSEEVVGEFHTLHDTRANFLGMRVIVHW